MNEINRLPDKSLRAQFKKRASIQHCLTSRISATESLEIVIRMKLQTSSCSLQIQDTPWAGNTCHASKTQGTDGYSQEALQEATDK